MTVDLACGELAFLDLTFAGLEAVPGLGEERYAQDLLRSPGGAAIIAIGAARLGLRTAVVSPIGHDPEGTVLRAELAAEGVLWAGREIARTAVTAVLPSGGERALATYSPGEHVTAEELAAVAPVGVVLSLPHVRLTPPGATLYATAGDAEAHAGMPSEGLEHARALIVNEREARVLTGASDVEDAARVLAGVTPCALVTRGPDGVIAAGEDGVLQVPGVPAEAVDTTGAGDLFTAAYVWADQQGMPLEERLRWAVLYAALSVRVPTAVAGAATQTALAAAGAEHGLVPPGRRVPINEEAR